MAQWSHPDRTLYAKLVYYGPALGGKTTNLQALHRITDPRSTQQLLSLQTADDRTLFFDLLPFDLGRIFGYQVAMKLFTVPGQVRYDATRRLVLAGADAVVFVADSSRGRREDDRASFENLRYNLRANGLDPATTPVLLQCNKQDLPDAAPPEEVATWLGMPGQPAFGAVAVHGRGVLETFVAATRRMLERLVLLADPKARARMDLDDLQRGVDRAFAPHLARLAAEGLRGGPPPPRPADTIVLEGDDPLERSVQASVALGDRLVAAQGRASRLEREVEALRELGSALRRVDASFDRSEIVRAALAATSGVLGAAASAVVRRDDQGRLRTEMTAGDGFERLMEGERGAELVARMADAATPCLVDDLAEELGEERDGALTGRFRAAASAPIEGTAERLLVTLAPAPDGAFDEADLRFLATVAAHLGTALDKVALYAELRGHRDALEHEVAARTEALRTAYDELRGLERMKDRFLSNLSHEMRSPLTGIVGAATCLRDYGAATGEREEMLQSILDCAAALEGKLASLLRVVRLEGERGAPALAPATVQAVLEEAVQVSGLEGVLLEVLGGPGELVADRARLALALANLLDNAVKFSPPGSEVLLRATPARALRRGDAVEGVALSVLDRGPGVPPGDRPRIFAPFEQGGDALSDKPAGLGMGLHEARVIAEQHGGALELHDRPGGGSEFRLVLPLRPEPADVRSEDRRAAEVP